MYRSDLLFNIEFTPLRLARHCKTFDYAFAAVRTVLLTTSRITLRTKEHVDTGFMLAIK